MSAASARGKKHVRVAPWIEQIPSPIRMGEGKGEGDSLKRAVFFQLPDNAIVYQILGLERAKFFVSQCEHANAVADAVHRRIDALAVVA